MNTKVNSYNYHTVVIGAGAAGMNCAKKLYEYMEQKGIKEPEKRIAVVTRGLPLGTSRMSGSDKQTYYKMGTSPDVADTPESFAESLTAGGCCHEDLAMAEGIGSLRGFYNLVEAGVPFPHNSMGTYVGYKTDHDPYERATSAGPRTSKFMSERLENIVRRYGIDIFDGREAMEFIKEDNGDNERITGIITLRRKDSGNSGLVLDVFSAENFVLAAGGPGAIYETTVYPQGQIGIHGIAFKAGLAAENLTEFQFGLASTRFRWNVSGTYMQSIPKIFSTDKDGGDRKEFLADFFPTMSKMATNIFLKGYQWPFDPQKIENLQSSLIDIIVFNETQKGRRVFMDFLRNPAGNGDMKEFRIDDLEDEALKYLKSAGAEQNLPIERLEHMNPLAIDIYKEHNIDLYSEPLEIAVCAQHSNGGFAVNKWWESNIKHTFVVGEMAGTHGVKRPGGSALNAGQVGAQRAAEYIVNKYGIENRKFDKENTHKQVEKVVNKLKSFLFADSGANPGKTIKQIQHTMTAAGAHIRKPEKAEKARKEIADLHKQILDEGLKSENPDNIVSAIQAEHLSLASLGYLKAIVEMLKAGEGSRGSHLVLSGDGLEIHKDIVDTDTGEPMKYKPENTDLKNSVLRVKYNFDTSGFFESEMIPVRKLEKTRKSFEPAWADYRKGKIYEL